MAPDRDIGATERLLHDLQERAKELACLYRVEEILTHASGGTEETLREVLDALPPGWQHPEICVARARIGDAVVVPEGVDTTPWRLEAPLVAGGHVLGSLEVFYTEPRPGADEGPFLREERKLLDTLADRVASFLAQREERSASASDGERRAGWWVILEFLRQTDRVLLGRLGRKMINHLCWSGAEEAETLLRRIAPSLGGTEEGEENRPLPRRVPAADAETTEAAFRIAPRHLADDEILALIEGWIREEKTTYLKDAVERSDTPLPELVDALQRFRQGGIEESDLSLATQMGLRASLTRRFLSDELGFVDIAKQALRIDDFHDLAERLVTPARSHGRVGGKAAGLFLAGKIVERAGEFAEPLGSFRVPRSWYLASDGILDFIAHNDLTEVHSRKYVESDRIRLEYPHLVQLFKSSHFSPEVLRGLSLVLEDLAGRPIIVRSSSLLEDRLGSAFSGKYKSLFLANAGSRSERLAALTDAIAEVYASVFSPDPIEYRARRGLLDLHEEMGILIQEVVGRRIGRYFLPAFSGVGFSNNEFRWSARIRREDGLLRLVPGLGTRAVDRLADDYPVLVAPGQAGLRVNQTADEAIRYSPRKLDVIDLETGSFETVELDAFLREHGEELPLVRQLVSVVEHDHLRRPGPLVDFRRDDVVASFEGLLSDTDFVPRMRALLEILRERLRTPVDVEFAHDGEAIYLLQCRPQGASQDDAPSPIPAELAPERVIFSAQRHVSNGRIPEITHVVYVDPDAYADLELDRLKEVGRVIGKLNRVLPKRQFVLMGPGRWGSRGDIRLGVPVSYADISNTALLVEIALKRAGYLPDLSFGTHFFQDLVESSIRYLPLYPDDPGVVFAADFLRGAPNALPELLPEFVSLSAVVRVIDVRRAADGRILRVLMNGDLDVAVGFLAESEGPGAVEPRPAAERRPTWTAASSTDHWRWRIRMARRIAAALDGERFGVRAVFLIGSTKNALGGPGADIDLLVHLAEDTGRPGPELVAWLEGWSRALAEENYLRTGVEVERLLDVRFVGDADVRARRGRAAKIDAVTDPALRLEIGRPVLPAGSREGQSHPGGEAAGRPETRR